MFDINRMPELRGVARPAARALIERLERAPRGYTLDIVSNADAHGRAHRRAAPGARRRPRSCATPRSTGRPAWCRWAMWRCRFRRTIRSTASFRGSGRDGIPSIGSWLLRGENGAITISLGSLTRLRSNPFWPLIDEDVAGLVAQDLAVPRR